MAGPNWHTAGALRAERNRAHDSRRQSKRGVCGCNKGRLGSKSVYLTASGWKLLPARRKRPGRTKSRLNERTKMRGPRQPVPGLQRTERGALITMNSRLSSMLKCVLFVVATASSGSAAYAAEAMGASSAAISRVEQMPNYPQPYARSEEHTSELQSLRH